MIDTQLEVFDLKVVDIEQSRHHRFYSSRNKFFWTKMNPTLFEIVTMDELQKEV